MKISSTKYGDRKRLIAYVAIRFPFGDSESFIWPEVRAHKRAGVKVLLAPLLTGKLFHNRQELEQEAILAEALVTPQVLFAALTYALSNPLRFLDILKIVSSSSPRVLLRNLAATPKGIWLGKKFRAAGVEHIHAHWLSTPATVAMIASFVSGIDYSVTAHRIDISQANLIPLKLRSSRFIRSIDEKGQSEIQAHDPSHSYKALKIYLGVELPKTQVSLRLGRLNEIRLVCAARFVGKKGHAHLIDAVKLARDAGVNVALELVGDGPLRRDIEERCQRIGVADSVFFAGSRPHNEVLAALRSGRHDVAVLPSVTDGFGDREGIPAFLMEAMAAGVPVVSTDNGGILELIRPGCGLIVPESDALELASAIVKLARDPDFRIGVAQRGREQVVENFSVEVCAARLRKLMFMAKPDAVDLAASD